MVCGLIAHCSLPFFSIPFVGCLGLEFLPCGRGNDFSFRVRIGGLLHNKVVAPLFHSDFKVGWQGDGSYLVSMYYIRVTDFPFPSFPFLLFPFSFSHFFFEHFISDQICYGIFVKQVICNTVV
jgi:hypothetical protein